VCQGVLKGVFVLGEEARLVQEFGRLKVREVAMQRLVGHVGNGLQQRQGDLHANHPRRLQESLRLRWEPVDACGQHRLDGGRHLNGRQRLRQVVGPRCAHQHAGFDEGAHALFQKEGVALGACNQGLREGCQTGVIAKQGL
jgi:hypothetical protein